MPDYSKLMATVTMASAAGAAALLYYTLNKKLQSGTAEIDEEENVAVVTGNNGPLGIERVSTRLIRAPGTWLETISTLSETLRFTYSETLGKWPIGDLAFGISFLLKRQGNLCVQDVFGGNDSVQLKGPEIAVELKYLLKLLTLCWHFSKKPFPLFLEETGYTLEDVLLQEPKAGIVGHSLGGGTAALLTFILREQKELSSTSCVTFAPAACMTWELAESGVDVITSIINGADLVPTFSAASVDDLRAEVTASAWLNDLRNQIEQTRILSTVYRSASALGASARAKVAGAGAVLRPVSSGTQAVMKRAQSMAHAALRRPAVLSSWSCIGPRRRANTVLSDGQEQSSDFAPIITETSEPPIGCSRESTSETVDLPLSSSEGLQWNSETGCSYSEARHVQSELNVDVADGEDLVESPRNEDLMTEVELWQQLEHELYDRAEGDVDVEKEIREEEQAAMEEVGATEPEGSAPEAKEIHRFFPPGKIMHLISLQEVAEDEGSVTSSDSGSRQSMEGKVGIFLTPRALYSKLRLSHSMISDHLMPLYRRQIEKLIREFENDFSEGSHYNEGTGVVL
ncbi:uncharacterized protein LOC110688068 isoform X2 [Chenopodium quinoa]|uniref:uncharacterized protein LOC110688068 isoform X2 n=1 Tax=Chenopodium quinoa TaxID=63459 RepID=UPI000B7885B4|nr:uncharacterized protein LOC110688068 isoform X2 [Chenopodium quinoa]